MRTTTAAGALLAMTILVAGCSELDPVPAPTTSSPTAAPTETAQPVLAPELRIPLSCEELLPLAEAAEFLNVDLSQLRFREEEQSEFTTAMRQAGALSCTIEGPVIAEDAGVSIRFSVLADAGDEFAQLRKESFAGSTFDSVSPGSIVGCGDASIGFGCTIEFLTNGYWAEIYIDGVAPGGGAAAGSTYAAAISNRLASMAPGPVFTPPATSFGLGASCAAIDDSGAFRAAIGSPGLLAPADDVYPMTFVTAVSNHAGLVQCSFIDQDFIVAQGELQQTSFTITPGGAWNWAALASELAGKGGIPIQVAGASNAVATDRGSVCSLAAEVGGSQVSVLVVKPDESDACAAAARVMDVLIEGV